MRKLALKTGGRPRSLDDLKILQELTEKTGSALLAGKGSFIVSGCGVTGNDIAPGYVYLDGELIEYYGETAPSFPVYLRRVVDVEDTEQAHEDGNTKA